MKYPCPTVIDPNKCSYQHFNFTDDNHFQSHSEHLGQSLIQRIDRGDPNVSVKYAIFLIKVHLILQT